jgi:preprotein translocase SecE subunit
VAKTRAQRKAERRRQQEQAQRPRGAPAPTATDTEAQLQTQAPESADAIQAELAERGADLDALRETPDAVDAQAAATPAAPAPSRADVGLPSEEEVEPADKISRRARRQAERERKAKAQESERRRAPREEPVERQRGAVTGFIASCIAELKRVQWPDRETLIQATAITVVFIAVMAVYLGVLDTVFNFVVQRIL